MLRARTERTPRQLKMLGHYHVLEELGVSALGALHLARLEGAKGFQRWAALRIVDPRLASMHATDLHHRARAAGALIHPNVAALFQIDEEEDGTLWMASEFVQGASLAEIHDRVAMARTPVPWEIAARMVEGAAEGLAAIEESAQRQRIRLQGGTASPWRMMVSFEGKTKIMGAFEPQLEQDPDLLPYTAPEEHFGEAKGAPADVFTLGVILWELCTARALFRGATPEETRALVEAHRVPRVGSIVRGFPMPLDDVIKKALASRPDARFARPRDLARAISAVYVAERKTVSDEDVARYARALCRDIADGLDARLREAADTTEVYRKHRRSLSSIPTPEIGQRAVDPDAFDDEVATEEMPRVDLDAESEVTAIAGRAVIDSMTDTPSLGADTVLDLAEASAPTPKLGSPSSHPPPPPRLVVPKRTPRDSFSDASGGSEVFFARSADGGKLVRKAAPLSRSVVVSEDTKTTPRPSSAPPPPPPPPPPVNAAPRPKPASVPTEPAAFVPPSPFAATQPKASRAPVSPSRGIVFGVIGGAVGFVVFLILVSLARGPRAPELAPKTSAAPSAPAPPAPEKTVAPPVSHAPIPTIAVSALPTAKPTTHTHTPTPRPHAPPPVTRGGFLTVMCQPACDEVLLDGSRSLGESPILKAPVPAGSHRLRLRAGGVDKTVEVSVTPDETTLIKPSMK